MCVFCLSGLAAGLIFSVSKMHCFTKWVAVKEIVAYFGILYVHFASEISSHSWYALLAMSVLILFDFACFD